MRSFLLAFLIMLLPWANVPAALDSSPSVKEAAKQADCIVLAHTVDEDASKGLGRFLVTRVLKGKMPDLLIEVSNFKIFGELGMLDDPLHHYPREVLLFLERADAYGRHCEEGRCYFLLERFGFPPVSSVIYLEAEKVYGYIRQMDEGYYGTCCRTACGRHPRSTLISWRPWRARLP